ncbi:hypothetical protein HNQ35_002525 [Cerasibacillus quisquiliarum]|uniref:Uncharacterized protein n=1 Tax=Cerasibacillus quisquiliarum TaxID=227865 RepID=A0A511UZP7_9BACI|nr:hypothetical protein [Cerasibacillus quisquiliarum]MBB5147307.1 hypothetical protein [Cerasibacillus quisquiliarum]GEN32125.1 hypothetical protein CQU01_23630 [Cerasibacillus quisquiliarum]
MRVIASLGVISIYLIFLVSCNGKDATYQIAGKDPIILVHQLEGAMEAHVEGELFYDSESKTLLLKNSVETGSEYSTPIWPKGTKPFVENGQHGVEIPDYGKIVEGELVLASGGGIEKAELSELDLPKNYLESDDILVISKIIK